MHAELIVVAGRRRFGGKYHDMSRNVAQVSSSGRQMSRHVVDILVRGGKANVEKNVTTSRDRAIDRSLVSGELKA